MVIGMSKREKMMEALNELDRVFYNLDYMSGQFAYILYNDRVGLQLEFDEAYRKLEELINE